MTLALAILFAASATPPEAAGGSAPAPSARVARQDGEKPLREAIDALKKSSAYRYEFTVHSEVPLSDPFDATGVGVMADGRVLSSEVNATGKIHRVIVAAGDKAMIWHNNMEAWVDSVAFGEPEAGRGVQNPNALLAAIAGEFGGAKVEADAEVRGKPCKVYSLALEGAPVQRVTGRLGVSIDGAKWGECKLRLAVSVAADGRIQKIHCDAHYAMSPKSGGIESIETKADVSIVEYDGARLIRDVKDDGKPVPLEDALKELGLDPAKFK